MSMNIFRLAGDMSHVFSIIVLLLRVRVAKNAQGTKNKRDSVSAIISNDNGRQTCGFTTLQNSEHDCRLIAFVLW